MYYWMNRRHASIVTANACQLLQKHMESLLCGFLRRPPVWFTLIQFLPKKYILIVWNLLHFKHLFVSFVLFVLHLYNQKASNERQRIILSTQKNLQRQKQIFFFQVIKVTLINNNWWCRYNYKVVCKQQQNTPMRSFFGNIHLILFAIDKFKIEYIKINSQSGPIYGTAKKTN